MELLRYKDLFTYEQTETKQDVLGDDFDARILAMTEESAPVKAKVVSLTERLKPLMKAVAVVAVILTLTNPLQVPFANDENTISQYDGYEKVIHGTSVALTDSAVIDSMKRSTVEPQAQQMPVIIK